MSRLIDRDNLYHKDRVFSERESREYLNMYETNVHHIYRTLT